MWGGPCCHSASVRRAASPENQVQRGNLCKASRFPSGSQELVSQGSLELFPLPHTQMQIFGAWHCYTDGCSWASVPNMTTFDSDNRWLIDPNINGTYQPSANLVVLCFVSPIKLMNLTTDSGDTNGIPTGMNTAVINYFQSLRVRVMLSIVGVRHTKDWDKAQSRNPTQLGINAANAAKQLNVGMEIDCERSSSPNLAGLQKFVSDYCSVVPCDPTGTNYASRLTIDLGNDDLYLTALANYATTNWLTSAPVLDYVNAMVASQHTGISTLESAWQQHVDGVSGSVPLLAPAKLTGRLWLIAGQPNCDNFSNSDQNTAASFVETIAPAGAGTTSGMLATCFGQPAARVTAPVARFRPTPARTEWGERLQPSTFPFQCRHCGSSERPQYQEERRS